MHKSEFLQWLNQRSTYLHHLIHGCHHQKDTVGQNDPLLHIYGRHLKRSSSSGSYQMHARNCVYGGCSEAGSAVVRPLWACCLQGFHQVCGGGEGQGASRPPTNEPWGGHPPQICILHDAVIVFKGKIKGKTKLCALIAYPWQTWYNFIWDPATISLIRYSMLKLTLALRAAFTMGGVVPGWFSWPVNSPSKPTMRLRPHDVGCNKKLGILPYSTHVVCPQKKSTNLRL